MPTPREPNPRTPAHPHGWLGYVVADDYRTRNALRLLRWAVAGAVLVALVLGTALVALAVRAPDTALLLGGASSAAAGGLAWRAGRRRARP